MSKKLDALQKKAAALDAQIKAVKARERENARKLDTRRKIIVGALALNHMEKNPGSDFSKKLAALINEYVAKPYERELFDLKPLPDNGGSFNSAAQEKNRQAG